MRKAHESLLGKNGYRNKLEEIRKLQKDLEGEWEEKMREYRIAESPFECILNKSQMELLLTFFNEHLVEEPISLEELEDIFMGKDRGLTYLLRLKDWKLFILLFKGLSGDGCFSHKIDGEYVASYFIPIQGHRYICRSWQKEIEDLEVFLDERGGNLTATRISRKLNKIGYVKNGKIQKSDLLEQFFEQLVALE